MATSSKSAICCSKPGGEHLLQLGKRGFARVRLISGG